MDFGQKLNRPIEDLKNLGVKSGGWLRDLGINTVTDLERFDPVKAYCILKKQDPNISRNMLHAMVAGLLELHYTELPAEIKDELDVKVSSFMKELT